MIIFAAQTTSALMLFVRFHKFWFLVLETVLLRAVSLLYKVPYLVYMMIYKPNFMG